MNLVAALLCAPAALVLVLGIAALWRRRGKNAQVVLAPPAPTLNHIDPERLRRARRLSP